MTQTILCIVQITVGAATRFWTFGNQNSTSVSAGARFIVPGDGTLKNLRVRSTTALPASGTSTTTVFLNNSATGLSVALTTGTQEGTDTDTVAVVEGDSIDVRSTTNSQAGAHILLVSIDYEADASWVTYAGQNDSVGSSGSETGLYYSGGSGAWDSVGGDGDLASVDGTLTNHHVYLSAAPGGGNTRTFTIHKNGVAQDGSGGTPDTRVTISDAATTGSVSFSLVVAQHDEFKVVHTTTGSPSTSHLAGGSCRFLQDTPDAWNAGAYMELNPNTGTTQYTWPMGRTDGSLSWDNTESNRQLKNGPTPFDLAAMRVDVGASPGSGKSWVFTLRKNGAATGLTVTISDANTSGSVEADVSIADGDLLSLESVPSGTPATPSGTRVTYAFAAADIVGSAVFGVDTTVTKTRAIAFGLDGTTNVHDEEGKFKLFGKLGVVSTPGAEGVELGFVEVALTSAEIKALMATPKTLVAAPGSGKKLEFVSAELYLDYGGTNVFTESADNLAVRFNNTTGVIVSQAIETTGFIDQSADTATNALPKIDAIAAKSGCENLPLVLHNTGDGEIAGNAANDNTMRVKVTYRVWSTGW